LPLAGSWEGGDYSREPVEMPPSVVRDQTVLADARHPAAAVARLLTAQFGSP
jgi:hypothetical protein